MKWLNPLWCFCHESHQNIQCFFLKNCSCLLGKLPWLTRLQLVLMQQLWPCSCHHYLLLLCMQDSCLCALICCLQGVVPLLHQEVTLLHVPVNREIPGHSCKRRAWSQGLPQKRWHSKAHGFNSWQVPDSSAGCTAVRSRSQRGGRAVPGTAEILSAGISASSLWKCLTFQEFW